MLWGFVLYLFDGNALADLCKGDLVLNLSYAYQMHIIRLVADRLPWLDLNLTNCFYLISRFGCERFNVFCIEIAFAGVIFLLG